MIYLSTDHWWHVGLKLQWFLCPNYCQEEVNIHSAEANIAVLGWYPSQSEQSFSIASHSQRVDVVMGRPSGLQPCLEENVGVHTLVTLTRLTQQLWCKYSMTCSPKETQRLKGNSILWHFTISMLQIRPLQPSSGHHCDINGSTKQWAIGTCCELTPACH